MGVGTSILRIVVIFLISSVLTPLILFAQSNEEFQTKYFNSNTDTEILEDLVKNYRENFDKNENILRVQRNASIDRIWNNPGLSDELKQRAIYEAHEQYKVKSRQNVAKYREPLVSFLAYDANKRTKGLKDPGRIKQSAGTGLYIRDESGAQIGYVTKNQGGRSDHDFQADPEVMEAVNKRLESLGFKPQRNGTTSDTPELEFTVNRNISSFGDPGTDDHRQNIRAAASNPETSLHISMKEKQVGKQSVALLDNLDKAKEGRGMDDPKALLEIENERKLQGYAKGTYKALGQAKLDDEVIEGVLKKNGLNVSARDYSDGLLDLKSGHDPRSLGLTEEEFVKFKKATDEIQDKIKSKAETDLQKDIKSERKRIDELRKNGADTATIRSAERDLVDTEVRYEEAQKSLEGSTQSKSRAVSSSSDKNPGTQSARPVNELPTQKKNMADQIIPGKSKIMKGMAGMGAVGDLITVYTVGSEATSHLQNGNFKKAGEVIYQAAKEEITEQVKGEVLTKIHPTLAMADAAFEVGYAVGEQVGQIDIGDGATVNSAVEDGFGVFLDKFKGTLEEERYNIAQELMMFEVKHGAKLSDGMTFAEAATKIRENLAAGKIPLKGVLMSPKPPEEILKEEMAGLEEAKDEVEIPPIFLTAEEKEKVAELLQIKFASSKSEETEQDINMVTEAEEEQEPVEDNQSVEVSQTEQTDEEFEKEFEEFAQLLEKRRSEKSDPVVVVGSGLDESFDTGLRVLAEITKPRSAQSSPRPEKPEKKGVLDWLFDDVIAPAAEVGAGAVDGILEGVGSISAEDLNKIAEATSKTIDDQRRIQEFLNAPEEEESVSEEQSLPVYDQCARYSGSDYERCVNDPCSYFLYDMRLFHSCKGRQSATQTSGVDEVPAVKSEHMHEGKCSTRYHEGAEAPEQYSIPIEPGFSQLYTLEYQHYGIKDRTRLYFNGRLLKDTQCTRDGGKWELPDLSAGGQIKIIIDPHCDPTNTGATKWWFELNCPSTQ